MVGQENKRRLGIVTDTFGVNLLTAAARFRTRQFRGPPSLEVATDWITGTTIDRLVALLKHMGYAVDVIPGPQRLAEFASRTPKVHFPYIGVINLAGGIPAPFRVGQAAILLEMLGVPYSGPDPQALLIMRDKALCKLIAEKVGIRTPTGIVATETHTDLFKELQDPLFPLIIKPNTSSNSVGLSKKITCPAEMPQKRLHDLIKHFPGGILIEHFVPGIEITVFRVGNNSEAHVVPLILRGADKRCLPSDFIYSTADKAHLSFKRRQTAWFLARNHLNRAVHNELVRTTHILADALNVRDLARFDFRLSAEDGYLYFIECNGQPSLNSYTGSIVESVNRLWYRDRVGVEREFLHAALKRMALL